jgi:hypothetical protein
MNPRQTYNKTAIKHENKINKILLHTCCAPCATAIVDYLTEQNIIPTLYYFNPNTFPQKEYELRKEEVMRLADSYRIDFVEGDYDHNAWLQNVKGLENEPEGGMRCLQCFNFRLAATARYANDNGFTVFATALATSRWKNLELVNQAGHNAAMQYSGLTYWDKNWRKQGLTQLKSRLTKEFDFYRQQYCGCEFSLWPKNKQ